MNNKKISIFLLTALVGLPQISETIYTPALPNVAKGLSSSAALVESSLAIYFVGFAIGVAIWGAISDWIGRKSTILIGLIIYGISTSFCGNAKSIEVLLFWRFIQAFGVSVGSVVTQTIIRDSFDGIERTKLFSFMSGALAFSPAIGPLLGGYISECFGWRANFWFLTVLGCLLCFECLRNLSETRPLHLKKMNTNEIKQLLGKMIITKGLWGHVILIGATNGIIFSFYQEAPFIFIEQLDMSSSQYGLVGILVASATLCSSKISYQLIHRFSANNLIEIGALTTFLGSCALSMLGILGLIDLDMFGLIALITSLFFLFLGIGLIIPNSLSQALKPFQLAIGTAGSVFGGLYYCLIALFTWIMSLIHNGSILPLPLYFLALSMLIIIGSKIVKTATITQSVKE